jgi:galactoside O-acetyltransferase
MNSRAKDHSFLTDRELFEKGFKKIGKNVRISRFATFYRVDLIEIGNNIRIDDFSVLTGHIVLGDYCHIAAHSVISGSTDSIVKIGSFCTFAYGVRVFARSDDYHGFSMTGSVVPNEFTAPFSKDIVIDNHCIIGASAIVFPGVHMSEGTALGSMSLLKLSTEPWGIYAGIPARQIKDRLQHPLQMQKDILEQML